MDHQWIAYHAFFHNVEHYDELICRVIKKFEEYRKNEKIEKWFFIRYWEGGPHLRFRMLNPKSSEIENDIKQMITEYIVEHPSEHKWTKDEYYKNHKFDGEALELDQLTWHEEGEVVQYEYIPEIDRYGGEKMMPYNETMFMYSSFMVWKMIEASQNNFLKKVLYSCGITYHLMNQLREVYHQNGLEPYTDFYKKLWQSFRDHNENEQKIYEFLSKNKGAIVKVIGMMNNSLEFKEMIGSMKKKLEVIAEEIKDKEYLDYIVASHIHMTNNRLGVPPVYEYFIAEILGSMASEEEI